VAFWRGGVLCVVGSVKQQGAAGVDAKQRGGANGGGFGEAAALHGLAVGLAAHSKGCSGFCGAGEKAGKGGEQSKHGGFSKVGKARRRVVFSPAFSRLELPTCIRQRMVDGNGLFKPKNNLRSF